MKTTKKAIKHDLALFSSHSHMYFVYSSRGVVTNFDLRSVQRTIPKTLALLTPENFRPWDQGGHRCSCPVRTHNDPHKFTPLANAAVLSIAGANTLRTPSHCHIPILSSSPQKVR